MLHIYTRVSTKVQDDEGTSLATQKELGIKKSKELKLKNKVWSEGSASSHYEDLANRPVLVHLLQQIEYNRIRIKEVGNERQWLDWVEKYADSVDSLRDFSKEEKKEYLKGIVRRINVSLDNKTNDHQLDLTFTLPLFGDWIEYQKKKSDGYRVIEGSEHASTVISYAEEQQVHKESRRKGR